MMNWTEEYKITTNTENNKLNVTLSVNHIKGTRGFQQKTYTTDFITDYLKQNKINFANVLQEAVVYNYQSETRCTGTWAFSLPEEKKTKKTEQTIENKENVLKMNSKKTTKK